MSDTPLQTPPDAPVAAPLRVAGPSPNGNGPHVSGPVTAAAAVADQPDPTPPYATEAVLESLRFEVDLLKRQARLNNVAIMLLGASLLILVQGLRRQYKGGPAVAGDVLPTS